MYFAFVKYTFVCTSTLNRDILNNFVDYFYKLENKYDQNNAENIVRFKNQSKQSF